MEVIPTLSPPNSNITLVARGHAALLASQRYANGLVGLEEDRTARKERAVQARVKVLADYELRKAAAVQVGRWVGG